MSQPIRILVVIVVEAIALALTACFLFATGHTTGGSFALAGLIGNTCLTDTFRAVSDPKKKSESGSHQEKQG